MPDTTHQQSTENQSLPHKPWFPFIILAGMWFVIALIVIPTWGWTYWDFGDGNYMYIARRVREGAILYKEILAPQPPLHTLSGMLAQSIGSVFGSELYGVRAFCLLLRFLASTAVFLLARRYFRCPFVALITAAVYLTLPIGFWWSMGYQSENLELIFLTISLWLIISWDKKQIAIAGVLGALACHTNMTGAPYLIANALFLAFRYPKLALWYLAPAISVYTVFAIGANIWTEGYFVNNVLLNQVGTFPRNDILAAMSNGQNTFLDYAWGKISSQSWEVLVLEAGIIAAAMVAVVMDLLKTPPPEETKVGEAKTRWHQTEFLAWSFLAGLLSICFTAKGGTVNYIFVLGEPMVAVFGGASIARLLRLGMPRDKAIWKSLSIWNTRAFLQVLFPLMALAVIYIPMIRNIRQTLDQQQTELPEPQVQQLRGFIENYAKEGDTILAPPFYAYLTGTKVAGELAENYIWNIKWMNESFDFQNYNIPTGEGVAKMEDVARMLRSRQVKVVLLDTGQTGKVPVIRQALEEHYQRAEPKLYRTRNTSLELLIPKDVPISHVPFD